MVTAPIRIAILDDFQIVVDGLTALMERFPDRVRVVDVAADEPVESREPIDIVLYDAFAARSREERWQDLIGDGWTPRRIALYTWHDDTRALPDSPDLAPAPAVGQAKVAHLSKMLDGEALVAALEHLHANGTTAPRELPDVPEEAATERRWPGQTEGLTERESEIVVLVVEGLSNDAIARRLFLSINTIKTYLRSAYRRMEVGSRAQAVLWGVDHGFRRPSSGEARSTSSG